VRLLNYLGDRFAGQWLEDDARSRAVTGVKGLTEQDRDFLVGLTPEAASVMRLVDLKYAASELKVFSCAMQSALDPFAAARDIGTQAYGFDYPRNRAVLRLSRASAGALDAARAAAPADGTVVIVDPVAKRILRGRPSAASQDHAGSG
jgi:hypothetical protein